MIKNFEVFITTFWNWWNFINPSWCIHIDDCPKIGSSGPLHKPGQNGFLTVLQILNWWQRLLGASGMEGWDFAVEDVVWVMKGVRYSLINSSSGKRAHDDAWDNLDSQSGDGNHSQGDARIRYPKR